MCLWLSLSLSNFSLYFISVRVLHAPARLVQFGLFSPRTVNMRLSDLVFVFHFAYSAIATYYADSLSKPDQAMAVIAAVSCCIPLDEGDGYTPLFSLNVSSSTQQVLSSKINMLLTSMRDSVLYKKKRTKDDANAANSGDDGDDDGHVAGDGERPAKAIKIKAGPSGGNAPGKAKTAAKAKGKANNNAKEKENAKAKQKAEMEARMKKALSANLGRDLQKEAALHAAADDADDGSAAADANPPKKAAKSKKKVVADKNSEDPVEVFDISRDDGSDKMWLDDVIAAMHVAAHGNEAFDKADKMQMIGCAFDFCFNGKLDIAGGSFTALSKLRPKLQAALKRARRAASSSTIHGRFLSALVSSGDAPAAPAAAGVDDEAAERASLLAMQAYADRVSASPIMPDIEKFMSGLSTLPPKHHRCINRIVDSVCAAHLEAALAIPNKADLTSTILSCVSDEIDEIVPRKWIDLVMEGTSRRFASSDCGCHPCPTNRVTLALVLYHVPWLVINRCSPIFHTTWRERVHLFHTL